MRPSSACLNEDDVLASVMCDNLQVHTTELSHSPLPWGQPRQGPRDGALRERGTPGQANPLSRVSTGARTRASPPAPVRAHRCSVRTIAHARSPYGPGCNLALQSMTYNLGLTGIVCSRVWNTSSLVILTAAYLVQPYSVLYPTQLDYIASLGYCIY